MTWIKQAVAVVLILCYSTAAVAQSAPSFEKIPKPTWERCGDQACMTLEETKNLIQLRAQYVVLFELVPILWAQTQAHEAAAQAYKKSSGKSLEAYDRLFIVYTTQEALYKKAVRDKHEAQAFSVFGDALPYVIVFGVACVAGGVWAGINL